MRDWNVEATSPIYNAITLLGAFIFSTLTLAFSAIAFFGAAQVLGGPLPDSTVAIIFFPPLAVLALWLRYRARWSRVYFGPPKGS